MHKTNNELFNRIATNSNTMDKYNKLHHRYTKTYVVKEIPKVLYCFTCKKERKVKKRGILQMLRLKMYRPQCKRCLTFFNVIKVKMVGPSRLEKLKYLIRRFIRRMRMRYYR